MYAIIESGSKQYKVQKDDIIDVELLDVKRQVTFDNVLLFSDNGSTEVGTPYVKGAKVVAKVLEAMIKDKKVTTFKYKNKINYHRTLGHRQQYTRLQITEVSHGA